MEKRKVAIKKALPPDFSVAPSSSLDTSASVSLPIPEIDKDAELKIEAAVMQPEELPEQEKHGKLLFIIGSLIGITILAGVVTLSILYFKTPTQKAAVIEPSVTPTVTQTPALIPNADITFEVLNGSDISGKAAKYGKQLETLGFKVSSLGNAEGEHTGLTIYIVASLDTQKDTLIANIQEEFPQASYAGVLTDGNTKVRLIIGK